MSHFQSGDVITASSSHSLRDGSVIQVYDSSGSLKRKGLYRTSNSDSSIFSIVRLKWWQAVWYKFKLAVKHILPDEADDWIEWNL